MIALLTMAVMAQGTPAATTVQQEFETATALTRTDPAAAAAAWERLEKRVAANTRSLALVRARKSAALLRAGRIDEAGAAAKASLSALPESDATLREDRFNTLLTAAAVARRGLDYAGAAGFYRQALAVATTPPEVLGARAALLEMETYVDPDAAKATLAMLQQEQATLKLDGPSRGTISTAIAEYHLNAGDYPAARKAADAAVKALGGLTLRVDIAEVAARSTYALAAARMGDLEVARQYTAFTGAGRSATGALDPGAEMAPPPCGGDDGLRPEDVAVVEFSIAEDGSVRYAAPVYSSRGGPVALAFARAALGWAWTPDRFKNVPAFFRTRARIELRCSTEFARPSPLAPLEDALGGWLQTRGVAPPPEGGSPGAASNPSAQGVAAVPLLMLIASSNRVPREDRNKAALSALAIMESERAPAAARLLPAVAAASTASAGYNWSDRYRDTLKTLAAEPAYAADPVARNMIALLRADSVRGGSRRDALALLQPVMTDASLPAAHPIKVGAAIRTASLNYDAGNIAAAKTAFAASGLDASQCAMLDAPPRAEKTGGTFPMEAMRWGFEGFTRQQFDIGADGKPANIRTLVAYPPLIFTAGGEQVVREARFAKTYRPDGGVGCSASTRGVVFRQPK